MQSNKNLFVSNSNICCIDFFSISESCGMEPSLVSDPDRYPEHFFKAEQALSNTDKNNRANWLGKSYSSASFVFDLGCTTSISTLSLRNGNNMPYRDRYLINPSWLPTKICLNQLQSFPGGHEMSLYL